MKHRVFFFSIVVILILSACAPAPIPTPTPILTLAPSATPIPEPITGTIFWDANGSGLQDDTSFIIHEFDPSDPPYFFQFLAANNTGLGNLSPGDLATVPEPPIPGITVCLGDICSETDTEGAFILQPEKTESTYHLTFIDPNADDPAKAFRYINKWNGPVVIESYEINGITVPKQKLNNTEIVIISGEFELSTNKKLKLGLVQGFLTFPFTSFKDIVINNYYDRDKTKCLANEDPHFCKNIRDWQGEQVTYDDHIGIDYDTFQGRLVSAANEGKSDQSEFNSSRGGYIITDTFFGYEISYNHADTLLLNKSKNVFRGQILHTIGSTGNSSHPHLHFDVKQGNMFIDPYRDLFENSSKSYWTVDNLPQIPLVEIIE
jgi:murein DD-endopeptidase MepM/ murein hydrolase activator NlpD